MAYSRFGHVVLGSCLLVMVCGCSGDNPEGRRAISGTVTLDGAPLKQGSISFEPQKQGGLRSGTTIADGRYSIRAEKGLPAGRYKVMIFASQPGAGGAASGALPGDPVPAAGELIPPEYNAKSDKFIEVTEDGPTQFDFNITTKE